MHPRIIRGAAHAAWLLPFSLLVGCQDGNITSPAKQSVGGAAPAVAEGTTTGRVTNVGIGQTVQLTTSLKPTRDKRGKTVSVNWTSDNPAVADVRRDDGRVTGVKPGTAIIRATAGSQSETQTVRVGSGETPAPAADTVVASVAVSLAQASVAAGTTTQGTAVAQNAAGTVLSKATFKWTTSNGAVATISATGLVTAVAPGTATITATASNGKAGSATVTVTKSTTTPPPDTTPTPAPNPNPSPTPPPPSGSGMAAVLALTGPLPSSAATRALGGVYAKYEDDFAQWAETWWTREGAAWGGNYYDRALINYTFWVRTGDQKYRDRADQMAVAYRRDYLEANGYGTSPHWSQLAGLELHYKLTGDPASQKAIAAAYAHGLSGFQSRKELRDPNNPYMDNRIQARVLQALLAAWRTQASYTRPDGMAFPASGWAPLIRDAVDQILSTQRADGSFAWGQICGQQLNYMVGMLNDVMIEYQRDFDPTDGRILPFVKKNADYLWNTQWIPNQQAFKYQSGSCASNGGSPAPAGDLNGLLVNGFVWIYQKTGDATYRTKADAIFAGTVNNDALTGGVHLGGSKQFNQQYSVSARYLGMR